MEKPHLLPSPHQIIHTEWDSDEIRDAVEKSRAALLNISSISTSTSHNLLINLANVENLFLIHNNDRIAYWSYADSKDRGEQAWEWGSRDMMLDLGDIAEQQQRMGILTAAANLTGRAVHILDIKNLTDEENRAWIEALSLAADREATPKSLLIHGGDGSMDAHGVLSGLKKNKGLQHLSLHFMKISDECIKVLGHFTSLISLHLQSVEISPEFGVKLAGLHPSDSPLAASLQRLHIHSKGMDWRRCTDFLRHWPNLKELSLESSGNGDMDLREFMEHLAPAKKEVGATTPQLYSLKLGLLLSVEFSEATIAAVVDALSRSGLPFFEYYHSPDPAVKAQLWKNQRNFLLGSDLKRVPATSIRLFICGDPFAGKTTLVCTMRSIYGHKRDKLRALFKRDRTQGIEVQAIEKDGIRVSLWDMAGQQEFHAFHDCMFPDIASSSYQLPSMFLFVWSPMDSESSHKGPTKKEADFEASFRYWLKFLASKSHQSNIALKVIVVFTRSDQMAFVSQSLSSSIDSLRSDFKGVIDIVDPPLEVDARKKASVKAVGECIFRIVKEVLEGIEVYDICTHISKYLWNHSKNTNEKIITWMKFSEICNIDGQLSNPTSEKAKLNIIALSLNESGKIIYINGIQHIVLDPNWFYNQIVGSLFDFPNSKGLTKGAISFNKGRIPRNFLEQKFESITRSQVKGSILVDLMEAMHLCYKVPRAPNTTIEWIFIPTILSKDEVGEQPLWSPIGDDNDTFMYMGRRLECENKSHTFLTPGLFPKIQVLFNNDFAYTDDKAEVTLGKDFISILFRKSEIIIMLIQEKSNYVIDVLVRAQNNTKENTLSTLAFVQKHIINTLITICAQYTSIQGVKLIESVIRPDCLCNPSNAQEREDQCVKISYLKEQLREKLEKGNEEFYEWTCTGGDKDHSLTSRWIDLLGTEYYEEVLNSCKQWFEVQVKDALLENDKVCINVSRQCESRENVITMSLENNLVQEGQTSQGMMDIQSSKFMVRSNLSLHHNMNSDHEEVPKLHHKVDQRSKKPEEIHKELQCTREDVISKVEKSINKLLEMAPEKEVDKLLPRVAFLMFRFRNSTIGRLLRFVPQLAEGEFVTIQLYCEHNRFPHPVKDQPGITLTCLSESQLKTLNRALPYINGFLRELIIAARLGTCSVVPHASSSIPEWSPYFKKLANGYPVVQNTTKSNKDIYLSTLESASKEWQNCLALILEENGGLTDENIAKKFLLKHTSYEVDGRTQVAWLCETHYKGKSQGGQSHWPSSRLPPISLDELSISS